MPDTNSRTSSSSIHHEVLFNPTSTDDIHSNRRNKSLMTDPKSAHPLHRFCIRTSVEPGVKSIESTAIRNSEFYDRKGSKTNRQWQIKLKLIFEAARSSLKFYNFSIQIGKPLCFYSKRLLLLTSPVNEVTAFYVATSANRFYISTELLLNNAYGYQHVYLICILDISIYSFSRTGCHLLRAHHQIRSDRSIRHP